MSLRDREINRRRARLAIEADISAYADTSDPFMPFEPCRALKPSAVLAVPGNAGAARKAGCEDAYDNDMEARYGEGF
jgi:hypothetical protein